MTMILLTMHSGLLSVYVPVPTVVGVVGGYTLGQGYRQMATHWGRDIAEWLHIWSGMSSTGYTSGPHTPTEAAP